MGHNKKRITKTIPAGLVAGLGLHYQVSKLAAGDISHSMARNELFYKFENKIFFLIIFPDYSDSWSFGKLFLQKYHILLDRDKKIFGVYPNDKNKIKIPFSWILIFILFITLISVLIYIKFFIVKAKRKIRANELDDDYEYITYDNQGEKLIN